MSKEPISRQVMNPPGDSPESRNLANTAPLQSDRDDQRRGKTGTSSRPEARPVTATARIRTETKPFGHTFMRQEGPHLQTGWYCACCGYFVVGKLTDAEKKRVCGRVTYPVDVEPIHRGDQCPACATGSARRSQNGLRCANCGWTGPDPDTK